PPAGIVAIRVDNSVSAPIFIRTGLALLDKYRHLLFLHESSEHFPYVNTIRLLTKLIFRYNQPESMRLA
ncbi:MAG: hypothetical protein WCH01_18300, partial [Methylococcaceae bacterium]